MKNRFSKFTVILLVLTMVFAAFAGCGSASSGSNNNYTPSTRAENTQKPDAEATPQQTEAAGNETEASHADDEPQQTEAQQTEAGNNETGSVGKRTVMVYIVGSNLESEHGAATLDLAEIATSGMNFDKTNVIAYLGGSNEWKIEGLSANNNVIVKMTTDDYDIVKEDGNRNMADPNTLADFIKYAMSNYSADAYDLILWDHGGGPFVGYGHDEKFNNIMHLDQIASALSKAGIGSSNKLELLGFDACLMGNYETAYTLKDYAEYFVGSEELEPAYGWDYTFLKEAEGLSNGAQLGKCIVNYYYDYNEKMIRNGKMQKTSHTLACYDLSKMDALKNSIETLSAKLSNNLDMNFAFLSTARNNSKSFGVSGSGAQTSPYDLIDLGNFADQLSDKYQEAKDLKNALSSAVVISKSNVKNANGMTIYHPYYNANFVNTGLEYYDYFDYSKQYRNYIAGFATQLSKPSATAWRSLPAAETAVAQKQNKNELSVKLTAEQAAEYVSSTYYILNKISDDEYMFVFAGKDAALSSDGTLSASYDNKAVFTVNKKTGEKSSAPIPMYQMIDGSSDPLYFASCMFWYFGDGFDMDITPVTWQLYLGENSITPMSAYELSDDLLGARQSLNYEDFSVIEFSFGSRTLKKDSSGAILPFFSWEYTGNNYGFDYNVEDGFAFEYGKIQNKGDYYVMFVVRDIHGNEFTTDLFNLPE